MLILGVNPAYHEHAAALLVDGYLVAVAEEERFNRVRHGKRARVDNADNLPWRAIMFCLEKAGVALGEPLSLLSARVQHKTLERRFFRYYSNTRRRFTEPHGDSITYGRLQPHRRASVPFV